jgi:hypothetical protein
VSERLGRDDLFWADRGVFNPPAAPHGAQATVDLRSNDAYADGILWFRPVTSAPDDGDEDDDNDNDDHACRDLVGNVAEFLCDSPVPPDGDVTGRAPSLRAAVVGGSALSPPELGYGRASPLSAAVRHRGFADVGFRLAFDAPTPSPADRIRSAIRSQDFMYRTGAGPADGPAPEGLPIF